MPGLPEHFTTAVDELRNVCLSTIDSGKALMFTLIQGQRVESCSYESSGWHIQFSHLQFQVHHVKYTGCKDKGQVQVVEPQGLSAPLGIHKGCMKIAHLINAYAKNKICAICMYIFCSFFSRGTSHSGKRW